MSRRAIELLFTGDLVLDEPQPAHWLGALAPLLRGADLAIGHLEVPHTHSRQELAGDVPAPGADPAHLQAIADAGFAAVTMAGNHIADCGAQGIADTISGLDAAGVAHCGAGHDLATAGRPCLLEAGGWRIALLSYNCVGPEAAWAAVGKAGCNYLPVRTADGRPAAPSADLVCAEPGAAERLRDDIAGVRRKVDLVIVALHKGIVHTPAKLAPYERPLAQTAIGAGADAVIGHHAHILRGVEFHLGKPVFHGLGNGCVVTRALSPTADHPARAAWARRRRELFGFEPDPAYTLAPFHPEARHALLAQLRLGADGTMRAGFRPVHVEAPGRPVPAVGALAEEVARYLADITVRAGMPPLGMERTELGYALLP